ncbi:MAG: cysteine hydrolase [Clostridia bacterium]|nr:cysteine hydrolase [Clostridia bacterium]MBQ8236332.1 cysteine hydrolase [Clostridia bacterium]
MNVLIVVDMQNDFITGALGSKEAVAILPAVVDKIKNFDGMVLATRDTHGENYLSTAEGKKLPVPHCIKGGIGWHLVRDIERLLVTPPIDKPTFGSAELGQMLSSYNKIKPIEEVTLIGVCTDICVISNALLIKAFLPEATVKVDASCCAGTTPEAHERALQAMKNCQIEIV